MDASRYFDAMHNAMSTQHVGAQLLLTVRLQDTCGNDAYLEVKQLPGEQSALVCYSTMGRRCLNFQLFRKGWQLCHNADGQLTGRFPSSADSLLSQTDFRAYCREDRLDAARTSALLRSWGSAPGPTSWHHPAEMPAPVHRSQWKVTLAAVHAGATGIRTHPPACRWPQFCTGWLIFWPGTSDARCSLTRRLLLWLRSGWQRTLLCSSALPLP